MSTLKELKAEIRYLNQQLQEKDKKIREVEADRALFRSHFARRLQWWIKLIGEGSSPNMKWLIEDDAKFLTTVKGWCWA